MQKKYDRRRPKKSTQFFPDARWIRKELPIADVARKLGLRGDGRFFECFREEHPRGKKRCSLSVHAKSNTVRCFACDKRSLSTIDLVMAVNGLDVGEAVRWLAERFPEVPLAKVRANGRKPRIIANGGHAMSLQDLITSPGWAALGQAAKIVLTAIFSRTPAAGSEQGCLRCSYAQLMEWTGFGSRSTIAAALKELRTAGAIQTSNVPTNLRTRRGFWLKQLSVRVSPRAMQSPRHTDTNATSLSVQRTNSQYAVQSLDSTSHPFQDLSITKGAQIQ